MELAAIILISFFISFTWIYYFKLIDLFEQEKKHHIISIFILGTLSPYLIFTLDDYILHPLGVSNSDNAVLSFLYYTLGVGLIEEIIKCIPVIIILIIFKKAINEPLDYIKYICISALGFAFGENILYGVMYGHHVLVGRSILTVPAHMFFSGFFMYGYVQFKYSGKKWTHILGFALLGVIAHGLYDFLLDFEIMAIGVVLNIMFFFLSVSAFITVLNNTVNISPFYTPKKIIDQEKVRKHLFVFYLPIIATILGLTAIHKSTETTLSVYMGLIFYKATTLYVIIVRLSRFTIIPGFQKKLRLEFPFYYKASPNRNDHHLFFGLLTVRGEALNEAAISELFEEEIKVIPLSSTKSYLERTYEGVIERKMSVRETSLFVLKLYLDESKTNFKHYILKSKFKGVSHTEKDEPIAGLHSVSEANKNKLIFKEWVILRKKKK